VNATADCLSGFALDRLRLGELDRSEAAGQARNHLDACARCAGQLAAQQDALPPPIDLAAVAARARSADAGRRRRVITRVAWVAVIAAVVIGGGYFKRKDDVSDGIKGSGRGWMLELIARQPNGDVRRIDDGSSLQAGTPIRFEVAAADDGFIAIVSLDATGKASPLAPRTGGALSIDGGGRRRLLDGAVAFDDTPGAERISYLHCRNAFDVETALEAARRAFAAAGGRLESVSGLGLGCHEQVFWLRRPGGRR
jgi:hypothetical protein